MLVMHSMILSLPRLACSTIIIAMHVQHNARFSCPMVDHAVGTWHALRACAQASDTDPATCKTNLHTMLTNLTPTNLRADSSWLYPARLRRSNWPEAWYQGAATRMQRSDSWTNSVYQLMVKISLTKKDLCTT